APPPVLVVVFHAEHDAAPLRIFQRSSNAVERSSDAVRSCKAGQSLAAQRAAMPRPEAHREIDRRLLTLDLAPPLVWIGMGEVGRKADHRGDLPRLFHRPCNRIDVDRCETLK